MDASMNNSKEIREAKEEIKPWIRRVGRVGFMAKGTVYFFIGILTIMAVLGLGGKKTGTNGMFRSLASIRFGEILLWAIGTGLIGYILWIFIKVFKDPENYGNDIKGVITRTGYLVGGIIYSGLAYNAFKIAISVGTGSGNTEQTMSARLLSQPLGQWIVGLVGVIIIGYGVYEFYQGASCSFMKKFHISDMDKKKQMIAKNAGRFGLSARGIVLVLIGFFFVQTALSSNPNEAKGLDGALSELSQQPHGQWLLAVAAVGLILYGIYQMVRGRYTRMNFGKNE
ncbi:DUF1206 domain-containing protein [Halobacillus litoralis]|uniref:DUF1206 domain-containing protein n=1 Tax=Halobacillus litoralis TaxID=45668 RepID=A0A410MBD2_9BACI|nr:DUF1206 domain-containing protein [Halobacillus litoralis]QAS52017.1 hypothetical protein HLI_07170 [Halobacillus litoralis]